MNKLYLKILVFLLAVLSLKNCTVFKNTPNLIKPEMVFIKGGTFQMGDVIDQKNPDALPVHKVNVGDFYIGKYEVTYAEFDEFARATGRPLPNDRGYGRGERAVVYVDWHDAKAYCNFWGWRLPSESEWEYAARSRGTKIRYAGTNKTDSLEKYAVTINSNINFSYLVGRKKPNALGLFDMSGNVMEYTGSFYQKYEEPDSLIDLEERAIRVMRGGSFGEELVTNQTFWRIGTYDRMIHDDVGFRCAISQQELDNRGFLNGLFHFKTQKP